ncbi:MAG: helix-turn-helix domain-containing protein [Acidobacteriota bacterium]
MRHVGRKLRDLRKARHITQSGLASRIGIQQSDLCRMENGQYRVSLETLMKLLSELEVSFGEFFQEGIAKDLSLSEEFLIRAYRRMSPQEQTELKRFLRFLDHDREESTE